MPALALKSFENNGPQFWAESTTSNAYGLEAKQMRQETSVMISYLRGSQTYRDEKAAAIVRLLQQGSGYASLRHITKKVGLRVEDFYRLARETKKFKKSLITAKDGEEVYRLNTPFGIFLDAWKTFCYYNSLKY